MADGFKIADAYVQVTAKDDTEATTTAIQGRLAKLAANIKLTIDTAATEAKIKAVQTYLDDLKNADVKVDADIAQAEAALKILQGELAELRDKKIEINVDTDKGVRAFGALDTANTKSLGLFTALTAGVGVAAAAIGAMPATAAALGGAIGVLGVSFNGVGDAMKTYQKDIDKGQTSTQAFADATKKLNQPQKDFVAQLIETQKQLKPLQTATSQAFLPGLTRMLKDSNGLFPIFQGFLTQTGTIMSDTAKKFGELFKSDQFKSDLQGLLSSSTTITKSIGDLFVQLTSKLVEFGAKMQPAAQGFADFIKKAGDGISGFLDALAPHAESFKTIFESLGTIIKALLPVIGEIAGDIADSLAPALKTVADWISNNKDKIKPIVEALAALWVTLKAVGLVADVTKWVTGVITQLEKLGPAIAKIPKGALGAAAMVGGLALADNFLPGSTKDDPDSAGAHDITAPGGGSVGYSDLKGFTGMANQALTDPGSVFKEIGDEWNQLVDQFKSGQSPIGAAWKTTETFFTQTIPGLFKSLGGTLASAWTSVSNFFTQTIPQFFQTQVVSKITAAWKAVTDFFTVTIPGVFTSLQQKLTAAWKAVTTFFTTTVPQAWDAFKTMLVAKWKVITDFFTKDIPQAWDAFKKMLADKWKVVTDFFTKDIPQAWDAFKKMLADKWKVVTDFFTKDIPQAWDAFKKMLADKWKVVTDFFTQDIPQAWDAFKQMLTDKWKAVTDFFTTDIPQAWDTFLQMLKDKWTPISEFFSKTIPDFLGTVPGLLQTAWKAITDKVTELINQLSQAVQSAGANASGSGQNDSGNAPSSANGNFFTPMAAGGVLTPMSGSEATMVSPNSWRVVGDNMKYPELFAPLNGSARSLGLIQMAAGTFGKTLVPSPTTGSSRSPQVAPGKTHNGPVNIHISQKSGSPTETGRLVALALRTV